MANHCCPALPSVALAVPREMIHVTADFTTAVARACLAACFSSRVADCLFSACPAFPQPQKGRLNRRRTRRRPRPRSQKATPIRRLPRAKCARLRVGIPTQLKDTDRLRLRIDNPVLRHSSFGVVAPLLNQISLRFLFAHHFQSEIEPPARSGFGGVDRLPKARAGGRARGTCPGGSVAARARTGPCHPGLDIRTEGEQ